MWLENGSGGPSRPQYRYRVSAFGLLLLAGCLAACGRLTGTPSPGPGTTAPATTHIVLTGAPSLTPPPPTETPPPTATPEPPFLTVNGALVTLPAYQRELARCQAGKTAAGFDPATCPAAVRQQLIDQTLIEQAATAAGLAVPPADLEAALARITTGLGGPAAYTAWLAANLYTADEFQTALRAELLRASLTAQITTLGPTAEQVHAAEILVANEATARDLLAQLQAGKDIATLALAYSRDLSSRAAGGDLGWFPRGLLTVPEVEDAAFALQPGETSGVVHSRLGYHIVQVIERDPARPLSPAAAQAVRAAAWNTWLQAQRAQAVVVDIAQP